MGFLGFLTNQSYAQRITSLAKERVATGNTDTYGKDYVEEEYEELSSETEQLNLGNKTGATESKGGFWSNVKNMGASVINGAKELGTTIASGVTSAIDNISEGVQSATEWAEEKLSQLADAGKELLDKTGAFFSDATSIIIEGGSKLLNWVGENALKLTSSVVNLAISFVKGMVGLIEALGDAVMILKTLELTLSTGLIDIFRGLITGDWDWKITKGMWNSTKSVVAYQWHTKMFDAFYETEAGKFLDEHAYAPFKSDGIACQVVYGVGYITGVIVITIATFGVGGVGVTASTLATTAAVAGLGKYTEEEWNKNGMTMEMDGEEVSISINYEKLKELESLEKGEKTTIIYARGEEAIELEVTALGDGEYSITDGSGHEFTFGELQESSTVKGLMVGTVKGAWEGVQWYLGSKIGGGEFNSIIGKITSPIVKTLARSSIRVGLDTLTGVAEVPFQSLVTMFSEGKDWDEAWKASGGWDAVRSQALIAGMSSLGGEALSFHKNVKIDVAKDTLFSGDTELIEKALTGEQADYMEKVVKQLDLDQLDQIKFSAAKDSQMRDFFHRMNEHLISERSYADRLMMMTDPNISRALKDPNFDLSSLTDAESRLYKSIQLSSDFKTLELVSNKMLAIEDALSTSDEKAVQMFLDVVKDLSVDNLADSDQFTRDIINVVNAFDDFRVSVGETERAYWSPSEHKIYLTNYSDRYTTCHEFGHSVYQMYDNLPDNYMNVMTQTRDYIGNHSNIIRDYLKQFDIDYAEAFQKEMKNFDASKESADLWRAAINEYDNNYNGVVQKFRSKGIDPNMIMTDRDSAITKVYEMMRADRIYNKLNEKTFGFDCLVQDIIDAVYGGLPINNPSVAGGQIRFGHFSDYYQSLDFDDYLKRRFNEQMANFYSLKRNAPEKLSKLKELLGDDCYQMFKTYAQKNYKWKS